MNLYPLYSYWAFIKAIKSFDEMMNTRPDRRKHLFDQLLLLQNLLVLLQN